MIRAGWLLIISLLIVSVSCKKKSPPPSEIEKLEREVQARREAEAAAKREQEAAKPAVPEPPAPPPAPPKETWGEPVEIATRDETTDIALQLDDARKYVEARDADLAAYRIEAKYVRSDGTLDPKYGELVIYFGVPQHTDVAVDDPSRPTGAPEPEARVIKPKPPGTPCPQLVYKTDGAGGAARWNSPRYFCVSHDRIVGPRCSVKTIWERAIAKTGATAALKDALAVIEIQGADARYNLPQQWRFRITDRIRKVDVRHTIADDCPMAVEK